MLTFFLTRISYAKTQYLFHCTIPSTNSDQEKLERWVRNINKTEKQQSCRAQSDKANLDFGTLWVLFNIVCHQQLWEAYALMVSENHRNVSMSELETVKVTITSSLRTCSLKWRWHSSNNNNPYPTNKHEMVIFGNDIRHYHLQYIRYPFSQTNMQISDETKQRTV